MNKTCVVTGAGECQPTAHSLPADLFSNTDCLRGRRECSRPAEQIQQRLAFAYGQSRMLPELHP